MLIVVKKQKISHTVNHFIYYISVLKPSQGKINSLKFQSVRSLGFFHMYSLLFNTYVKTCVEVARLGLLRLTHKVAQSPSLDVTTQQP